MVLFRYAKATKQLILIREQLYMFSEISFYYEIHPIVLLCKAFFGVFDKPTSVDLRSS